MRKITGILTGLSLSMLLLLATGCPPTNPAGSNGSTLVPINSAGDVHKGNVDGNIGTLGAVNDAGKSIEKGKAAFEGMATWSQLDVNKKQKLDQKLTEAIENMTPISLQTTIASYVVEIKGKSLADMLTKTTAYEDPNPNNGNNGGSGNIGSGNSGGGGLAAFPSWINSITLPTWIADVDDKYKITPDASGRAVARVDINGTAGNKVWVVTPYTAPKQLTIESDGSVEAVQSGTFGGNTTIETQFKLYDVNPGNNASAKPFAIYNFYAVK